MRKLLLSVSFIALSMGAAISQTNSITAGNAPTSDGKGYLFNFDGGILDNCITSNGGQYYAATVDPFTISGTGSLIVNVPTQTTYNSNPDYLHFYTGNCSWSSIDLSSPANHKYTISINVAPAPTSTTTSRQLLVIFYNGSNNTYNNSNLPIFTITTGSNIITSTSQGNILSFGSASSVDSTQITGIGLLIRGAKGYNDVDAAGTYSIDYISIGDASVPGTNTGNVTSIDNSSALASQISLYPNPATSTVNLDLSALSGTSNIRVLNTSGAVVLDLPAASGSTSFNVNGLNKGLYFVQISNDNSTIQKKFMVD